MNKIPVKIKVLLGAMVVAAVLIIAVFFVNILPDNLGANILKTLDLNALNQKTVISERENNGDLNQSDIDSDGLLDYEEVLYGTDPLNPDTDGDDFWDGEEVASKRNPLVPGPNDELTNNNLTEKISQLTISGLIEGSLKPSSPDYVKSLNLVVDEILYQSEINLFSPQVLIKTVPDNEESLKKYLEEIVPLIETMIDKEGQSVLNLADIIDETNFFDESRLTSESKSFLKLRDFADKRALELSRDISLLESASVPKTLEKLHQSIVRTSRGLALNYKALTKADSDSIQAMLAFHNIVNTLINELPTVMANFYRSSQK